MSISQYFRKDNPFDYIVLAFIMKMLGVFFAYFISYHISYAFFGVISWFLIIKGIATIPQRLSFPFSSNYKALLALYFILVFIMILRGYIIDYQYPWISTIGIINFHLFDPTYVLCYFMPLFALIPIKYFNIRLIVAYSSLFVIITIIMAFIYRNDIITSSMYGAMNLDKSLREDLVSAEEIAFYRPYAFIPLLSCFLPPKKRLVNFLGLALVALLMMIGARRGATMLTTILLLGALFFYSSSKKSGNRFFFRFVIILCLLLAGYVLYNSSLSDFILERGLEDDRSGVEDAMLEQMNSWELWFGKGLNGRYYFPLGLEMDEIWKGFRYGVETGFYNLVLKGGYVFAFTYILLLAIPAYKGLFKSNNLLCKAGGFYIMFSLFSLWPFGLLSFDLSFLFIWMMVPCCMNKAIREMNNDEIKQKFFYNLK